MPMFISEPLMQSLILGSSCYALTPGGMIIPSKVSGLNDKLLHALLLGGSVYIFTQYVRPSGWYSGMWMNEKRTVNNSNAPYSEPTNKGAVNATPVDDSSSVWDNTDSTVY